MASEFSATISKFVRDNERVLIAVVQDATQSLIVDAQLPVAKGGRMRVDTGFLRLSGQVSLSGLPIGPSRKGETSSAQDANLVIADVKPGDTIWFGWTAEYAIYREAKDAFLGLAVQRWQVFIDAAVAKGKAKGVIR